MSDESKGEFQGPLESPYQHPTRDGKPGHGPDREPDEVADPAHNDDEGHDWSAEGGATTQGPATSVPAQNGAERRTEPGS